MSYRLVIRPTAEADISDAALWYQKQEEGLGSDFLAAVDAAMKRALVNPRQFQCVRRRPDVRRVLTSRFPYRIFYILQRDAVVVIRVLHNARDDREWKQEVG
jgi:toxin ParE1/3/4